MMEWDRGREIGRGAFSTVHIGTTSSSDVIAVKSSEFQSWGANFLVHEENVLHLIGRHQNIIRCVGADVTTDNRMMRLNLLLEYAQGGSLAHQLKIRGGKIIELELRIYTRQLLFGLAHVHQRGFAHLDIKPSNLLLTESGVVKIADFGLAGRITSETRRGQIVGTLRFMAPESIKSGLYGPSCDVWAVGCTVSELASGRPAWAPRRGDAGRQALMNCIGHSGEIPAIPDELSEEGKDFLRKCFVRNPWERWTAEMLLRHPFVSDAEYASERFVLVTVSPRYAFELPFQLCEVPDSVSILGSFGTVEMERFGELSGDCVEGESWVMVRG